MRTVNVFLMGDRFEMVRVDTMSDIAGVVKFQTSWNFSIGKNICVDVCPYSLMTACKMEFSIPFIHRTCPQPTCICLCDRFPKTFFFVDRLLPFWSGNVGVSGSSKSLIMLTTQRQRLNKAGTTNYRTDGIASVISGVSRFSHMISMHHQYVGCQRTDGALPRRAN